MMTGEHFEKEYKIIKTFVYDDYSENPDLLTGNDFAISIVEAKDDDPIDYEFRVGITNENDFLLDKALVVGNPGEKELFKKLVYSAGSINKVRECEGNKKN